MKITTHLIPTYFW